VSTAPSTSAFSGKPDSVVRILRIFTNDTNKNKNLDSSFKNDSSIVNHQSTIDNSKVVSYKNYSDSLGGYHIKVVAPVAVDSIDLTVHHFAMETLKTSTGWKWYAAIGAAAVLILEFILKDLQHGI
jgi:hypothetical protein